MSKAKWLYKRYPAIARDECWSQERAKLQQKWQEEAVALAVSGKLRQAHGDGYRMGVVNAIASAFCEVRE